MGACAPVRAGRGIQAGEGPHRRVAVDPRDLTEGGDQGVQTATRAHQARLVERKLHLSSVMASTYREPEAHGSQALQLSAPSVSIWMWAEGENAVG